MDVKNVTKFFTRTDVLNAYLSDINKYTPMTAQEEMDLFAKMEDATPEEVDKIKQEIVTRNNRFVFAVAKRYATGDILPDLINQGNLGLYEAFDKYDWRSGNRFCSFAVWYIRRAIYGYLVKENLLVRPTNNAKIAPKVKEIENLFYLTNCRKPTTDEVREILKDKYEIEVADNGDIYGAQINYIDASVSSEDDDMVFEDSAVFNEKTASQNGYVDTMESEDLSYAMSKALATLSDRERTIVKMNAGVGYDREYKDKEIAEELGLTSERVRQIRHAAISKMKEAYMKAEA